MYTTVDKMLLRCGVTNTNAPDAIKNLRNSSYRFWPPERAERLSEQDDRFTKGQGNFEAVQAVRYRVEVVEKSSGRGDHGIGRPIQFTNPLPVCTCPHELKVRAEAKVREESTSQVGIVAQDSNVNVRPARAHPFDGRS